MKLNIMNDECEVLGQLDPTRYGRYEAWLDKDAIANFLGYKTSELDITEEASIQILEENGKAKARIYMEYTVDCYNDMQIIFTYYPMSSPSEIFVELKDSEGQGVCATSIQQIMEWGA